MDGWNSCLVRMKHFTLWKAPPVTFLSHMFGLLCFVGELNYFLFSVHDIFCLAPAHSTQGRAVKRKQTHASAHPFPYLPNQRMIRALLVRGRSAGEGKALEILCPDLVRIIAVITREGRHYKLELIWTPPHPPSNRRNRIEMRIVMVQMRVRQTRPRFSSRHKD